MKWLSLLIIFLAPCVYGKELTHRLGVGYKNPFAMDLPGIAVQYYPYHDIAVSAILGVDTKPNMSKFGFVLRGQRVLFKEDNLNFYMGGGAGTISEEVLGTNESGVTLSGFVGAEFFLQGLDSLGFSFETGVDVASVKSGVRFRTVGDSPVRAGMIFYF